MASKIKRFGCESLLSSEMEIYLEDILTNKHAVELITGAPISILEKRERLLILFENVNDSETKANINSCINHISSALSDIDNMSANSVIVADSCWCDLDDGSHLDYVHRSGSESLNMPYVSFEDLLEGILDRIQDNTGIREWAADEGTWYEFVIARKTKLDNGRESFKAGPYRYIMIGSNICYIECSSKDYSEIRDNDYLGLLGGSSDLNLPVPFKPGDIVNLDCAPFADPCHLIILSNENNPDCCGLRGAFADEEGRIHIDSVKHGHCFPKHYISRLSPLYRMSLYSGPLFDNEKIIMQTHLEMSHYSEVERGIYGRILEEIFQKQCEK